MITFNILIKSTERQEISTITLKTLQKQMVNLSLLSCLFRIFFVLLCFGTHPLVKDSREGRDIIKFIKFVRASVSSKVVFLSDTSSVRRSCLLQKSFWFYSEVIHIISGRRQLIETCFQRFRGIFIITWSLILRIHIEDVLYKFWIFILIFQTFSVKFLILLFLYKVQVLIILSYNSSVVRTIQPDI